MKRNYFRRISAGLFAAVLLLTGMTVPGKAAGFTDVPANCWARDAIDRCVEQGFFRGESDSRFGMGHPMTRAAFAVVLTRFFGWENSDAAAPYSDVPTTAWYAPAVAAAYEHDAVTHQTEQYRPDDPITREEMTVMLIRALGYGTIAGLAQKDDVPFTDVESNAGYIAMAYELGIVSGTGKTAFSPGNPATREQTAVILMRLYDRLHTASSCVGCFTAKEAETADLAGYDAVVLTGAEVNGRKSTLTDVPEIPDCLAGFRTGGKMLLQVTVRAAESSADAEKLAAVIAQAAAANGFDGVLLELCGVPAAQREKATALAAVLDRALEGKLLYLTADAPERGKTDADGWDYAALSESADRLILQINPFTDTSGSRPVSAAETPEAIYYALKTVCARIGSDRVGLRLTASASAWQGKRQSSPMTGAELERLLQDAGTCTYWSARYACPYLENGAVTVWYLNGEAAAARRRIAGLLGVQMLCLTQAADALPGVCPALG